MLSKCFSIQCAVILFFGFYYKSDAIEFDAFDSHDDVYLSPTRLKQTPHDTPASVSKVTQETIRALQISSVPDLLKYVAGMVSSYASGNQPRINYHGTNGLVPRRMQVLLDGVSVYRPSYAEVNWPTLPISIVDIDSVEITRSPSAASYGENSMMAVINIKTKDPFGVDQWGVTGSSSSQNRHTTGLYSSGAVSPSLRYRISVSAEEDDGFDTNVRGQERHDGTQAKRFNAKLIYDINKQTTAELFLAYSDVLTELEYRDQNQQTYPDITTNNFFVLSKLNHQFSTAHDLTLKTQYTYTDQDISWNSCYPAILFSENLRHLHQQNPDYAASLVQQLPALVNGDFQLPTGGTANDDRLRDDILVELDRLGAAAFRLSCGWINEDATEKKIDIELEDKIIISDHFRLVLGLGFVRKSHISESFLEGTSRAESYRMFSNAEYRVKAWVLNVGAMLEYEPSYLKNPEFSPRLGLNYRLSDSTSLRTVFSKAVRTPDILEYDRNWSYLSRDLQPDLPDGRESAYFYFSSRATTELMSEEIIARELSLYSNRRFAFGQGSIRYSWDLKYFYNSLSQLISEKLQFIDYNPTNDGYITLQGAEFESQVSLNKLVLPSILQSLNLHVNYAYIDNDTDEFFERSLHAQHSGAAYAVFNYHHNWFSSLAYYGNSSINGEAYDAWELGLGKVIPFRNSTLTLRGKMIYEPDKQSEFVVSESFNVQNNNEHTAFYQFAIDYAFH